jgi:hypothetical protein
VKRRTDIRIVRFWCSTNDVEVWRTVATIDSLSAPYFFASIA